jgi:hypothetical protein
MKYRRSLVPIIGALALGTFLYFYSASPSLNPPACRSEQSNGLSVRLVLDATSEPVSGVEVNAAPAIWGRGMETVTTILLTATTNASGVAQVAVDGYWGSH